MGNAMSRNFGIKHVVSIERDDVWPFVVILTMTLMLVGLGIFIA